MMRLLFKTSVKLRSIKGICIVSKGYITIAINSRNEDYIRAAYALALSLKATQKKVNALTVVVEDRNAVDERYRQAFDKVVVLPSKNLAVNSTWKVENYYQLYDASPYDETVTVDADTLFVSDISDWWDEMGKYDIDITSKIYNYKNEIIKENCFRKDFYKVGLPDIHNGFLYFKKGRLAHTLFKQIEKYAVEWKTITKRIYGSENIHYSSDNALNIAVQELGIISECIHSDVIPTFVHMKTLLQGWENAEDKDWRKYINYEFDENMGLKIGGYTIKIPFHYHIREFISDELLEKYECFLEKSQCL